MPKKFEVHLTRNAQNDLVHIFFYIASDNINNAKKFILERNYSPSKRLNCANPRNCNWLQGVGDFCY